MNGGGYSADTGDAISSVYDWHQKQGLKMPTYTFEALGSQGPFECTLTLLDGSEWRGRGKKKSEAKAASSREALRGGLDKALARRAANLARANAGNERRAGMTQSAERRARHKAAGTEIGTGAPPVASAWATGRLNQVVQQAGNSETQRGVPSFPVDPAVEYEDDYDEDGKSLCLPVHLRLIGQQSSCWLRYDERGWDGALAQLPGERGAVGAL